MTKEVNRFGWFKMIGLLMISCFIVFTVAGQKKEAILPKTVIIDAGHGGKDPGTVVGGVKEKNVVLDIALKLGNLIRNNQKNIKVIYTRDGDYFVPLMDRAQMANKINANLFISIHANYCGSPEIYGTETYVLGLHRTEDNLNVAKKENSVILLEDDYTKRYEGFNPNLSESYIMFELLQDAFLDQSLRFASILQSNFKELAQRRDREVRQAGFLVLRETSMPSVLIETGYLSNKKENSFLMTDAGRSEIAHSIYGSLVNYLNKNDIKENLTIIPEHEVTAENVQAQPKNLTKPVVQEKPVSVESREPVVKKDEKSVTTKVPITKKEAQAKNLPKIANEPKAAVPSQKTKVIAPKDQVQEARITKKNSPDLVVSTANVGSLENSTTYAFQIGMFSKKIELGAKYFKGVFPVRELIQEGRYKYFCFESSSLQTTRANFGAVKAMFPDAFLVSIKNNQIRVLKDGIRKK
jgi:N-acetylmuramoyl-L-alanine amidase